MNAKQAKKLRRAAELMTEGKPGVVYRKATMTKLDKNTNQPVVVTGTITLHPECTRAVYKDMKKRYKRAA